MQRAHDMNATVKLDPSRLNPSYFYRHDAKMHHVWFLNAEAVYYQLQTANSYRPAGYALWRLGAEDPSIWWMLPHRYGALPVPSMAKQVKDISVTAAGD